MSFKIFLTGDVNLMNVIDPAIPFVNFANEFRASDLVFSNLECCFYQPPGSHSVHREGFFANPSTAEALRCGGIQAVGIANNVNYGEAAINSSIAQLDALGISHTGAGANLAAARVPVTLERNGMRTSIVQRTAVYWPTNHEATENGAGVAVVRGHTAYQVPMYKMRPEAMPLNRPGLPPVIVTWADPADLQRLRDDITSLRVNNDVVVASVHWGLYDEVLEYMTEFAHAAIDAGADIVVGHGPHCVLPVEVYRGKPIFYGLGSFSFHTGHGGIKHGDWVGMLARVTFEGKTISKAAFQFVRHNDNNETVPCRLVNENTTFEDMAQRSAVFGTKLSADGDQVAIALAG